MIEIVQKAGIIAMDEYKKDDNNVSIKEDGTPVSRGDFLVNDFLEQQLLLLAPDIPIVSEEVKLDDDYRTNLKLSWLIDPIDGTKAFISKDNGEFTINIALIQNQRPIFGIVYAPYFDELYYAHKDKGAFKITKNQTYKLPLDTPSKIIYISKNHHSEQTQDFINNFEKKYGIFTKHPMNSSLKLCKVAEGRECIYPKFGGTSEWDIGASDIILFEANSVLIDQSTNKPPLYNKESLRNNHFIAMDKDFYENRKI
jgi:3'(2'), 5'-bisphosphate nucleotidase